MACSRLLSTVASSVGSGKIDVRDDRHLTIKCTGVAGRAFSEFQVVGRNPVIGSLCLQPYPMAKTELVGYRSIKLQLTLCRTGDRTWHLQKKP